MILSLISVGAFALTAKDVFEAQTYAMFDRKDVSIKVKNGSLVQHGSVQVAQGDVLVRINTERDDILQSLGNKLQADFVNYQFPEGMLGNGETQKDRNTAETILSNGVAEFILEASFGSDIKKGLIINRPNSKVEVLTEEGTGRNYLLIFGEKIYVDQ